jgi:hypothetical protein
LQANREKDWPDVPFAAAEAALWGAYAKALRLSYWSRRRGEFFAYREALRDNWPAQLERPIELGLKWYPDWVWACKKWIDQFRGGQSSRQVTNASEVASASGATSEKVGAV